MQDSAKRLIAAATRTLRGDVESKSSAGRLLEILREERPDQEAAAIERWDAHDAEKRKNPWSTAITIVVAGLAVFMLIWGVSDLGGYERIVHIPSLYRWDDNPETYKAGGFSQREKQLLKIPSKTQSASEMAKSLWDSELANAAYFSEYSTAYFVEKESEGRPALPPVFLETANWIDPGNAFFHYWAADFEAAGAVTDYQPYKTRKPSGSDWHINAKGKLGSALALLHKSRNLQECRNYQVELIRRRIPLMSQATPHEYDRSSEILSMASTPGPHFRALAPAIAANAWQFAEIRNKQGLLALKEDADAYLRNISRTEPGLMMQEANIETDANIILSNLTAAAIELGLASEVAEMKAKLDRLEKLKIDRSARIFKIDGQEAERKLSIVSASYIPDLAHNSLHPPVLHESDVRPGRMMDHTILQQLDTYGACLLLAIAAGMTALYQYRSPRLIRDLSARMLLLLSPVDWAWLFVTALVPFVYTILITSRTPLGGRDWNVLSLEIDLPHFDSILLPTAQFIGMFSMMLILPVLAIRWRLGKRVGFFGFGKTPLYFGWLALICAAEFMAVLGQALITKDDLGFKVSWGLFVVPLGWLVLVVIRALTTGMTNLLHITTIARVLVPTYAAAMVILLMTTPYFHWSRQRWFEQDPMARFDVKYPSLSRFEYETSVAARKELREALGYDTP